MTYVSKSCPHCSSVYIRHQMKGRFIGSPFRVCNKCGKKFIDKDFVEIAFLPPSEYEVAKVTPGSIGTIAFGLFGMAVSFCLVGSEDWSFYLLFFAAVALLGVVLTVSDIKDYTKRKAEMDYELAASKTRISNPDYLAALISIGVNVPKDYMKRASEADPSPAPQADKGVVASPGQKTPAYYCCWFCWRFVGQYIEDVDSSIDRKQHMYLWAAAFYASTKAIGDQQFIDEMYSHFGTFAIRRVRDPEHRSFVVDEMREDYRQIRPLLNSSKIDPCSPAGAKALWAMVCPMIYPNGNTPSNSEEFFIKNLKGMLRQSLRQYESASSSLGQVRYSISASGEDFPPPDPTE